MLVEREPLPETTPTLPSASIVKLTVTVAVTSHLSGSKFKRDRTLFKSNIFNSSKLLKLTT